MLRIHETAVQLIRQIMPLLLAIERCDRALAQQGKNSANSTPLNIAEGSDQSGKRRGYHYRIALGSARETWSVLRCGAAASYIEEPSKEIENKFNEVIGTLHRCIYPRRR